MADNDRIFLFEEEKKEKTPEEPKVVMPKAIRRSRVSYNPSENKTPIDDKEFAPIIIDKVDLPVEFSENTKSIANKEKSRMELEAMVRMAVKKKEEEKKQKEAEKANIEANPENTSGNNNISLPPTKDNQLNKVTVANSEYKIIKAKLQAQAILAVPSKKSSYSLGAEESSVTNILKYIGNLILFLIFPTRRGFRKLKGNKASENSVSNPIILRQELELIALAAKEKKKEKDRKDALIKQEIEREAANKKITTLNVDNSETGITLSSSETDKSEEIRKQTFKRKDSSAVSNETAAENEKPDKPDSDLFLI